MICTLPINGLRPHFNKENVKFKVISSEFSYIHLLNLFYLYTVQTRLHIDITYSKAEYLTQFPKIVYCAS